MTVNYTACDLCGRRMTDGCVIDVRYREVRDGKKAQAQKRLDVCGDCWATIKGYAESRKEAREGAEA